MVYDDPPDWAAFRPPPLPVGSDPLVRRKSALRPWLIALAIGIAGSVAATLIVARIARERRLEAERLALEAYSTPGRHESHAGRHNGLVRGREDAG